MLDDDDVLKLDVLDDDEVLKCEALRGSVDEDDVWPKSPESSDETVESSDVAIATISSNHDGPLVVFLSSFLSPPNIMHPPYHYHSTSFNILT